MTEGRRCQVHLLDDRKLELLVQPKLMAKDLLDLVASHFNLKEKEYFGIAYVDETSHFSWLQLDRRVLEHEFPKKSGPIVLYFCVSTPHPSISATDHYSYLERTKGRAERPALSNAEIG
uniref:FERM domain-containing protein n=1 Tax=Knipowitschia caucasica TaxID=637954 RepID=A0AAV2KVG3_KNICA